MHSQTRSLPAGRRCFTSAAAIAAAMLLSAVATADTVHVPSEQPTIQAGIDAAGHAGTVIIAPGTYMGTGNHGINMGGLSVTVTSSGGAGSTIIDCDCLLGARAFSFTSPADTAAIIENLTVRNGVGSLGGAIYISAASPTIRDCVFESCSADDGGAIYASSSASPTIRDCTFTDNTAIDGGALYVNSYVGSIQGCVFIGNSATNGGALSLMTFAEMERVLGCLFRDNTADKGGAIYYSNAETSIDDCSFHGNTAATGGGIYFLNNYNYPEVTNCSFIANTGGGLYNLMGTPDVSRCIFAFDETSAGFTCAHPAFNPTITHCVVFGNAGGDSLGGIHTENLFEDPLLCGLATGDLTLCGNSKCLVTNSPWGVSVGAYTVGCGDCDSPVRNLSWGALKGIYRKR